LLRTPRRADAGCNPPSSQSSEGHVMCNGCSQFSNFPLPVQAFVILFVVVVTIIIVYGDCHAEM